MKSNTSFLSAPQSNAASAKLNSRIARCPRKQRDPGWPISEYVSKSRETLEKLNLESHSSLRVALRPCGLFGSSIPISVSGFRLLGRRRETPLWATRACCFPSNFSFFRLSLPSRHRLSLGWRTSATASVSPNLPRISCHSNLPERPMPSTFARSATFRSRRKRPFQIKRLAALHQPQQPRASNCEMQNVKCKMQKCRSFGE